MHAERRFLSRLVLCLGVAAATVVVSSQRAGATGWGAVTVTGLTASQQIVDVDVSDDGQVVAVVGQYNHVYVSRNGGSTWSKPASVNPSTRDWVGVDVSPDGQTIVAAYNGYLAPSASDGGVWISTDSGVTWSDRSPTDGMGTYFRLSDVAMSDNGQKIIACGDVYNSSNGGRLWVSTNGGATWSTGGSPSKSFRGCTMNASGSVMYANANGQSGYGSGGGGVFKSTDDGATWVLRTPTGSASTSDYSWFVATDATGSVVMASVYSSSPTNLYVSTNGGTSWVASTSTYSTVRRTFVSRDGSRFIAAVSNGFVESTNGTTYTATTVASGQAFSSFAATSDMSKAWATHYSSGVFSNGTFNADTTAPTLTSGSLLANGQTVRLVFNEAIHATTAPASAFTVTASAVNHTPTAVAVSGSNIDLTLPVTLEGTATLTVAYVAPASNSATSNAAVQDLAGNDAASFSNRPVTNNSTADATAPTVTWTSPSTPSSTRTLSYTLTFSEAVSGIVSGDFRVLGTATGCTVTPSAASTSTSITVSVTCSSDGTVLLELLSNTVVDGSSNTGPSVNAAATQITINTSVATTTTAAPVTTTTVVAATTTTTVVSQAAGNTTVPVQDLVPGSPTVTTTTVARSGSPSATSSSVAPSGGGATAVVAAPTTTTGPAVTTTVVSAPALPVIEVPRTEVGGASALIGGVEVTAEVTRANNELIVDVGPIAARIWATARSGGKVPLDAEGRLRLQVGDSVTVDIEGFDAATPVEVRLYSDPVLLGRSQVGASGTLAAAYEIPGGVEQGNHTVVLVGTGKGDSVTLGLSVAIGDEPTGINPWVIILPIGLAVLGALLLPVALRRRRREAAA